MYGSYMAWILCFTLSVQLFIAILYCASSSLSAIESLRNGDYLNNSPLRSSLIQLLICYNYIFIVPPMIVVKQFVALYYHSGLLINLHSSVLVFGLI